VTQKFNRFVLFSACAAVISMFTAGAATCVNGGSLTSYEALGSTGCTYGGYTFSNFSYTDSATGGGTLVTSDGVNVFTASNGYGNGLSFDGSWNAFGAGSTSDGDIMFSVSVNGGGAATIADAGLAQTAGVTGSGVASVAEQGCGGTNCVPGTWQNFVFDANGGTTNQSAQDMLIAPNGTVNVSKNINVMAGSAAGYDAATISLVTDTFSTVPEPRALSLLLGLGLVGGFVFRKKLQAARA